MGPVRAVLMLSLLAVGCGPQTGTRLSPLLPRTAVIGRELEVLVHVESQDPRVALSYDSDIGDLKTRRLKPSLTPYAGGDALFRWTPLADDRGEHVIRFTAALDGTLANTLMPVTVVAGQEPITFRQPIGDGTTLDLARASCVDVPILIEDSTVTEVMLEAGDPFAEGGVISQDGPLSGKLSFCPSMAQASSGSIFAFTLVAADKRGQRAEKRYLVVLEGP
jgi:hypothetical protein